MLTRADRLPGRPLLVLVTGAPGSGKTTLARHLGDHLRMPVVSKDLLRQGTMWTLATDRLADAPPGPLLWYGAVEAHLRLGVSVIGEMSLFRGVSEPDIASRLEPLADLVAVHCRSELALDRFEQRARNDALYAETVDALLGVVQQLQHDGFEPHELGCPTLAVETTDGYRPSLTEIVDFIASSGPSSRRG